jgi:hypothetical protein
MLLAVAFFGVAALGLARAAIKNDRGLIIDGLIALSQGGATIFFWVLAALSGVFVAVGLAGMLAGRSTPRFVRLTPAELSAPKNGFARQPTSVRLGDIHDVYVQEIKRQRMLTIRHAGGSLTIMQSMLPGAGAFEELHDALIARLQHIHTPVGAHGR